MYTCENWTIMKAEHQRTDAFELWCWRRLLRVLWTARRSNQSILKKINHEYPLQGLMLKLKLHYFGLLLWRANLLGKDPDAAKDWRHEEKGTTEDEMVGWHHWLDGHEFDWASSRAVMYREVWHATVYGVTKSQTQLNNWTDLITPNLPMFFKMRAWTTCFTLTSEAC